MLLLLLGLNPLDSLFRSSSCASVFDVFDLAVPLQESHFVVSQQLLELDFIWLLALEQRLTALEPSNEGFDTHRFIEQLR